MQESDLGDEEGAAAATARRIASLALPPGGEESSDSMPMMQQQQAIGSRLGSADGAEAAPAPKPAKPSLRELTDKKRAVPKRLADVRVNPAIAASFTGARTAAGGQTAAPASPTAAPPGAAEAPPSPPALAPPSPGANPSSEDDAGPAAAAEQPEWQPQEEEPPAAKEEPPADKEEGLQAELSAAEGPAPEGASEKVEAALAEDCSATQLGPNTFNLTAFATAD